MLDNPDLVFYTMYIINLWFILVVWIKYTLIVSGVGHFK